MLYVTDNEYMYQVHLWIFAYDNCFVYLSLLGGIKFVVCLDMYVVRCIGRRVLLALLCGSSKEKLVHCPLGDA